MSKSDNQYNEPFIFLSDSEVERVAQETHDPFSWRLLAKRFNDRGNYIEWLRCTKEARSAEDYWADVVETYIIANEA